MRSAKMNFLLVMTGLVLAATLTTAEIEFKAIAVLRGTAANEVCGYITFAEDDDSNQVTISGSVSGVLPAGSHGFHVHQFGDCSAPDFTSAGPHFNPEDKEHSGPEDSDRHVGDLGNIAADSLGNVTISKVDGLIRLKPGNSKSIIGRAVIIHQGSDDLGKGEDAESKKTGNAGKRLACGVIGIAKL